MRPPDLPPADRLAHGTRARYVTGCRCVACRAANAAHYHERQRRGIELAVALGTALAAPTPITKGWTPPGQAPRLRTYRQACPGVLGQVCSIGAHLRRDSKGGVCRRCRDRLSYNGLVDARPVRRHLARLASVGIGRDAVSAASDVSGTVINAVMLERQFRVRASVANRLLAVTKDARADGSLIPAAPTWRLLDNLLKRGFTKAELARRLGSTTKHPALQVRRDLVLASTALRVRKLYKNAGAPPPSVRRPITVCGCARPLPIRDVCAKCERPMRANERKAA